MELSKFLNLKIVIETPEKQIFRGKVIEYTNPETNENGKASILIRDAKNNSLVEFYEEDIEEIYSVN